MREDRTDGAGPIEGSGDGLRTQRDRFLAFAFVAADLLVETSQQGEILFASGAAQHFVGQNPADLIGRPFASLLGGWHRRRVEAAIRNLQPGCRLTPTRVRLIGGRGGQVLALLHGHRLPHRQDRICLALSAVADDGEQEAALSEVYDSQTRVLDAEHFAEHVTAALKQRGDGDAPLTLSLLEFEALAGFSQRTPSAEVDGFLREVGTALRSFSADGEAVGRLAEEKFAVLHDSGVRGADIGREIEGLAKRRDPSGNGLRVAARNVSMASDALTPSAAARAAVAVLKSFADDGIGTVKEEPLADTFRALVDKTVTKIGQFKKIIADDLVDIAYQPIVDLKTRTVHHYEVLARFKDGVSPQNWISFGENLGMIEDFDLLMCRKVIDLLADAGGTARAPLAVNVSGSSLSNDVFAESLLQMIRSTPDLADMLLFEVTESSEILDLGRVDSVLQAIRAAGYRICLDDFGAGFASFQYLQALTVDCLKIDGAYVKRLRESDRDRVMIKGIVSICQQLGIDTIAEMIEAEDEALQLSVMGVRLGQGYLFGRPQPAPGADPGKGQSRSQRPVKVRRVGYKEEWA